MFRKGLFGAAVSVSLLMPVSGTAFAVESDRGVSVAEVVTACLASEGQANKSCPQLVEAYLRALAGLSAGTRDEALRALALQLAGRADLPGATPLHRLNAAAGLRALRRALADPALAALVEQAAHSLERPVDTAAIRPAGSTGNATPADDLGEPVPLPVSRPAPEPEPENRKPAATIVASLSETAPDNGEIDDADDVLTGGDLPDEMVAEDGEDPAAFTVLIRRLSPSAPDLPGGDDAPPPVQEMDAREGTIEPGPAPEGTREPDQMDDEVEEGVSD